MSNYTVISDVSEGLRQILFTEFARDPVIRNLVVHYYNPETSVTLKPTRFTISPGQN